MNRLLIAVFAILPIIVSAQWGMTPNQAMVKQSIEPSLVVICSAYKLQDGSGQRYGRNNRAEFSQGYTLGVVTDAGLLTAASSIKPWLYDADYARYSRSHKPLLSATSLRQIGDSSYGSFPLAADSSSSLIMCVRSDSLAGIPALSTHNDTSYRDGWMLWCFVSDTLGKAGAVSTSAIVCPAVFGDSVATRRVATPAASGMVHDNIASCKPIGAVWVVPTYPKAGTVQFRVAGMAVKDSTGWMLVPVRPDAVDDRIEPSLDEEPRNELTPMPDGQQKQGKRNKKNKKNK